MRILTKQQIKLLDAFFEKTGIYIVEDIPKELWDRIVKINDTEVLYQNAQRYLSDLQFKKIFAK